MPTNGSAPLTVSFTNISTYAQNYSWNFGDGSPVDHGQDPVHIYSEPGIYTVQLNASGIGGFDQYTRANYIEVTGPNGTLQVVTNLGEASYSVNGPITLFGTGVSSTWTEIPTGQYQATFFHVPGYETPSLAIGEVVSGTTLFLSGQYLGLSEITLTQPDGGEVLAINDTVSIQWTSENVTGNVAIELDAAYPSGNWTTLFGNTLNDGNEDWIISEPEATNARIRIYSLDFPTVGDTSSSDFAITYVNNPPRIFHDPHEDATSGFMTFVAYVIDDSVTSVQLFTSIKDSNEYTATNMIRTPSTNQYIATRLLDYRSYEYYIGASDEFGLEATTDTYDFDIRQCPWYNTLTDGTAEGFNWVDNPEFEWAIRIDPISYPYVLCGMKIAISPISPDTIHSPIRGRVLLADGAMGMPGTEVWSEITGSIGNYSAGMPTTARWATVIIRDQNDTPLNLTEPFYLAISNPVAGNYEAFGRDDDDDTNISFFYDGYEESWYSEDDPVPNAYGGTRMFIVLGYNAGVPQDVVISRVGNDILLTWSETGSPFYHIYGSENASGPFDIPLGTSSDTTFVDTGTIGISDFKFYTVFSSPTP